MDSFELNKIAGAVLATLLIYLGLQNLGNALFHVEPAHPQAYIVENVESSEEPASIKGDEAADEAPDMMAMMDMIASASVDKGKKVAKKCIACHAFEKGAAHKIGPALYGVVNRDVGSTSDYAYSEALTVMGGNWNYETLDSFLLNPKKYAAGTKMAFVGLKKPGDRAAIIAYLRSIADTPAPLSR